MSNKKSKKFIFTAAIIIIILTFSIVIASQNKDMTWLSIFEGNNYKIRLGNDIIKLKKTDNTVALSADNLKTMLMEHYNAADVHVQINNDYKPDANGIISLIIEQENEKPIYSLGQLYFLKDNGWTTCDIELSIDDKKFLYVVEDKPYTNILESMTVDLHSRLINRDHSITNDFNIENIVPLKGAQAVLSSKGMMLDKETLENLKIMLDKAAEDGVKGFVLNSTYRSYQEQKSLFDYRFNERKNSGAADPYEEAAKIVAYPGTSEHQTGMALDILSTKYPKGATFHNSDEYAWLKENCWDYGFIPRYPEDKQEITRISFEPWHYRYISRPLSLYAKETGYCLEEVVESLQNNKFTEFKVSDEEKYIFLLLKKEQSFMIENGLSVNASLMELTAEDNLVVIK